MNHTRKAEAEKRYSSPVGIVFLFRRRGPAFSSDLGGSAPGRSPYESRFFLSHIPLRYTSWKPIGPETAISSFCGDAPFVNAIRSSGMRGAVSRRTMNITTGLGSDAAFARVVRFLPQILVGILASRGIGGLILIPTCFSVKRTDAVSDCTMFGATKSRACKERARATTFDYIPLENTAKRGLKPGKVFSADTLRRNLSCLPMYLRAMRFCRISRKNPHHRKHSAKRPGETAGSDHT